MDWFTQSFRKVLHLMVFILVLWYIRMDRIFRIASDGNFSSVYLEQG